MTRTLLRLEGAGLLLAAVIIYAASGLNWWLFAVLLLVPDLSMLGYMSGPRVGAHLYNAFHTTVWGLALAVAGYAFTAELLLSIGLIWLAHIGMDRALGYGLKEASSFQDTHLGRIGKD